MVLLGLALAPVSFIFTYLYLRDEFEREPLKHLVSSFIMGAIAVFIAIGLEIGFEEITGIGDDGGNGEVFLHAMFGVAFIEELVKWIPLLYVASKWKEFDEPYDGIMYGASISLGFAALENIGYVMDRGMSTAVVRMFTAVPGHAFFGIIMGYFVGAGRFEIEMSGRWALFLAGLVLATVSHGLYDFFLMANDVSESFALWALVLLVVCFFLTRRAIKLHQEASPHKKDLMSDSKSDDKGSDSAHDG